MDDFSLFWDDGDPMEDLYLDWAADHPVGFVLDRETLHRNGCPRLGAARASGLFEVYGFRVDAEELETGALRWFGRVIFCPVCDPPSAYFDVSQYRTWEQDPPTARLRVTNCRSDRAPKRAPKRCA